MANALKEAMSARIAESKGLFEKWGKTLKTVNENVSNFTFEKKFALAKVLENTQSYLNARLNESRATQSADVGQFKRFALDILSVAIPNLIAYDLVSVQPIDNRVGMVNYIEYVYNSTKGSVVEGQSFTNPFAMGQSDPTYTTAYVPTEAVTSGAALRWHPIVPGSVKVTQGTDTLVDDGAGKLMKDTTEAGTVNYATGVVTLTDAATAATVAYAYNNEFVPANDVPELGLVLRSTDVKVKARHLAVMFAYEAKYELQKEYTFDIESELTKMAAGELNYEIDVEICNDLINGAPEDKTLTWSKAQPVGVTLMDHYDSFNAKLVEGSIKIFERTKRIRANWVLVGTQVYTVISNMRNFNAAATSNLNGPFFAGTLGDLKVYVNPVMDAYTFLLGYKGNGLFEAGYVYCPYMPIMSSDLVTLRDMSSQKGFITMYATKMLNPLLYVKGTVTA